VTGKIKRIPCITRGVLIKIKRAEIQVLNVARILVVKVRYMAKMEEQS